MNTKEYRYRIIKEANLNNDRKYFVQIFRQTNSWIFKKYDWQYETEPAFAGGFYYNKTKEFQSFEEAQKHVNSLARKLSIIEEGSIERDSI